MILKGLNVTSRLQITAKHIHNKQITRHNAGAPNFMNFNPLRKFFNRVNVNALRQYPGYEDFDLEKITEALPNIIARTSLKISQKKFEELENLTTASLLQKLKSTDGSWAKPDSKDIVVRTPALKIRPRDRPPRATLASDALHISSSFMDGDLSKNIIFRIVMQSLLEEEEDWVISDFDYLSISFK